MSGSHHWPVFNAVAGLIAVADASSVDGVLRGNISIIPAAVGCPWCSCCPCRCGRPWSFRHNYCCWRPWVPAVADSLACVPDCFWHSSCCPYCFWLSWTQGDYGFWHLCCCCRPFCFSCPYSGCRPCYFWRLCCGWHSSCCWRPNCCWRPLLLDTLLLLAPLLLLASIPLLIVFIRGRLLASLLLIVLLLNC